MVLQAQVTELDAVVEEVHDQFQSLDQQMSRASQTATKVGDRLQVGLLKFSIHVSSEVAIATRICCHRVQKV